MKKYKFFALAFAAMTLAACSSDDVVDDGAKGGAVAPGEQGYVSLSINLPTQPGTRIAENYDAGTAAENDVKTAYLMLFSGASESAATFQSAYKLENLSWTSGGSADNIAATSKYVQLITRPATGNIYAFVVLNGGGGSGDAIEEGTSETAGWKFGGQPLASGTTNFSALYSTALSLQLANVTGSEDGFLMTNAPLYTKPGGTAAPTDGSVQTLAPVDASYIYDSQADAQNGVAAADVYVERAVAKVSVTGQGTTGGQGLIAYTLKGYDLDVTNNKTYLVRNVAGADWWGYKNSTATGANQYRFVGSDVVATTADGNLYRTYFGKDPNYDAAPATGDLSIGGTKTYNTDPKYCFENTFDVANMRQNVTTHVVIAAALSGLKNSENQDITGDFYTMYGDKETLYDDIADVTSHVMKEYLANATIAALLTDDNIEGNQEVGASDFDVTYDSKATTGGYVKVATVTVKEASKSKFKNGTVPTGLESNTTVLAAVNSKLNIAYYKGGVSYYPVMIKHFGDAETPWSPTTGQTESYPGTDKAQQWLGRYGVLRNNSYQITVNNVKQIGYPENPGSYPGSFDDPVESWIGVTINILPWVVRTQEVSLGE